MLEEMLKKILKEIENDNKNKINSINILKKRVKENNGKQRIK